MSSRRNRIWGAFGVAVIFISVLQSIFFFVDSSRNWIAIATADIAICLGIYLIRTERLQIRILVVVFYVVELTFFLVRIFGGPLSPAPRLLQVAIILFHLAIAFSAALIILKFARAATHNSD
jgi:hypothetical protein